MKIKKMQTLNFQGLTGQREWTFDRINVLCQPNSAGKSSLLNAIKYGLSGKEPEGTMVSTGTSSAAVGMVLENDANIIRQKTAGGTTTAFLDKKKTSKRAVDQAIVAGFGIPINTIKVASSEEALKALQPQEFGDLILGYTADQLDIETVSSYVPDLTEEMKQEMESRLPHDLFGVTQLQEFYAQLFEARKQLKKAITEKEGALKILREYPKPVFSKEELDAKEKELITAMEEAKKYKELLLAYQKSKKAKEDRDKAIAERTKAVEDIKAEKQDPNERKRIEEELTKTRKLLDDAKKILSSFELSKRDTEKVLKNLSTSICPLSEKLICTTDKTPVKDELEKAIKNAEEGIAKQNEMIASLNQSVKENEKALQTFDRNQELCKRKELILNEIDRLKNMEIPEIEEPKNPKKEDAEANLRKIKNQIKIWDALEKADKIEAQLESDHGRKRLETLEAMVKAFAPKGPVMERITEKYMVAFEEVCNEKAKKLRPGMSVKFVAQNGVHVLMDFNGDENYLEYNSLSGGEKAVYIYLMLDLLNTLSGLRILIIDELSVLDKQAFASLLDLMIENQEDYDHIFIAMVDHDDTENAVTERGLKKLVI